MTTMNLEAKEILKLEFEYARETATQAQDDRTTIVNLYLLLIGGVSSVALALPQLSKERGFDVPGGAYALLFGLLALLGFFTVMKLVRLRQAWYESVHAMNVIKKFYLERIPELEDALLWKTETIPAPGKPWTITFNLMLLIAIVDSVALGTAFHFTGLRFAFSDYAVDVFAAVMYFLWQIWFYFMQLPTVGEVS